MMGVCGLSCRLCPMHQTDAKSRCAGCKSKARMAVGCPFITCAVKNRGTEFCWDCTECDTCRRWKQHREVGKQHDSFKSYQTLEDDILFIQKNRVDDFENVQKTREQLLKAMLRGFNEGRLKSYYCIAATVLRIEELRDSLSEARRRSVGLDSKQRSRVLHSILESVASERKYLLELRK
jgi:hypothetical protein